MKTLLRRTIAMALALLEPLAAQASLLDLDDAHMAPPTSEFVYRGTARGNLVPIHIMGAVGKPGLYFVPPNTPVLRALTLAGGPQTNADAEEILVRKADRSWENLNVGGLKKSGASYRVDVEDLMRRTDHGSLPMSPNDVVFVPTKEPFINSDMMRVVTIVSLVATTILTAVLIDERRQKKN